MSLCDTPYHLIDNVYFNLIISWYVLLNAGPTARSGAAFGQGSGPIFLDNVLCSGLENMLFNCAHSGIEISNISCSHQRDAGVVCVQGISDLLS